MNWVELNISGLLVLLVDSLAGFEFPDGCWVKLAKLNLVEWNIYREGAAEISVAKCYFKNSILKALIMFGKHDQFVDFGELGAWVWRREQSGKGMWSPPLLPLACPS